MGWRWRQAVAILGLYVACIVGVRDLGRHVIQRKGQLSASEPCISTLQDAQLNPGLPRCTAQAAGYDRDELQSMNSLNPSSSVPLPYSNPVESFNPTNAELLPGAIAVTEGSTKATTTRDLTSYINADEQIQFIDKNIPFDWLKPSSVNGAKGVQIQDYGVPFYTIKEVYPDHLVLTSRYNETSDANMSGFKRNIDADGFLERLRREAWLRRMEYLNHTTTTTTTTETSPTTIPEATTPIPVANITTEPPAHNVSEGCDGIPLPGTLSVLLGSRIVSTSKDLRSKLSVGDSVEISGMVYIVTEPQDEKAFSLSDPYEGENADNLHGCKTILPDLSGEDLTLLSGCMDVIHGSRLVRTHEDVRQEIRGGETIRLRDFESVVTDPRDSRTLTMEANYTGPSQYCVPAYKKRGGWFGGLIPLCGTMTVTLNSNRISTSCDLRSELNVNDIMVINNYRFTIESPFTASSVAVSSSWPDPSQTGLKAFKQAQVEQLPGTAKVIHGSTMVATTDDLRGKLLTGDIVKILQNQFQVVDPLTDANFAIESPYPGATDSGVPIFKIVGTEVALSSLFTVTAGSTAVTSTADVRGQVGPGDNFQIANQIRTIANIVSANLFTVNEPYDTSASNAPGFKVGKSADVITLEALALEKLKCKTIYCLAKLEEQERGIPFPFPRNLAGGADGKSAAVKARGGS